MLKEILAEKQKEIGELRKTSSIESFLETIDDTTTRNFQAAIAQPGKINIIAEIKKASPSKGIIVKDFNPVTIAAEYTSLGAAALSVLTDEKFFLGHKDYISLIKQISPLPILRKDFILDKLQIYESRALGADAVLLIAAILSQEQIMNFLTICHQLNMQALVEVHNESDLQKALNTSANIIGINNRNLEDFSVDLNTTIKLLPLVPQDKIIVSESGIFNKADIPLGINAVLIGEGLTKNIKLFH